MAIEWVTEKDYFGIHEPRNMIISVWNITCVYKCKPMYKLQLHVCIMQGCIYGYSVETVYGYVAICVIRGVMKIVCAEDELWSCLSKN